MAPQIEPGSDWLRSRGSQNIWSMGRLKPEVSPVRAALDLGRIAKQIAREHPDQVDFGNKFELSKPGLVGEAFRGPIRSFGVVLTSIAGVALLLACLNLASMLLARASDRHREIGIRLALGAGRWQLLRQLMTESLILAAAGGVLGLAIAFGACRLFSAWHLAFDIPIVTTLEPDGTVLGFTAALALFTTLLFGLTPALQAVRADVLPSLRNEPALRRFRHWHVRDILVGGQIALSVIALICSVLVVRSLQHALTLNLGFNPDRAVSVSFDLRLQRYSEESSRRFDGALVRKAAALPGLESVGMITSLPLQVGGESNDVVTRTDRPIPKPSAWRAAIVYSISPGYLKAARTRLLAGRDLNDYDRNGAPAVVIVNEALAHVFFANEDPLGKRIRLSTDAADRGMEVVGVVETGKYESIGEDPHPAVFEPIAQTGTAWTTLVARTSLPSAQATELLRKAVFELDPNLTLFNSGSLKERLAMPLFPARAAAIVLGIFGIIATALAATGLFALMANAVSRRRREIGIRMALGAQPLQVLGAVLARTLLLCAAGIVVGTLATLAGAKLLSAILYGVSPHDPVTYVSAITLLAVVGLLACWNPVARAVRIDPSRTLREE
jgi:predicted permease